MASPSSNEPIPLRAVYTSTNPTTTTQRVEFSYQLSSSLLPTDPSQSSNAKAKTAYLSELKDLVIKLQGEINVFLTERMEEDKNAEKVQGGQVVSEKEAKKEEENYGEETVEDDA